VLRAPYASAQALGGVSVSGACPTESQVVAALAIHPLPDAARNYRLAVHSAPGHSEFVLTDAAGRPLLDRFIASDDCTAMADVVALVTEAFFVELVAEGHPPDDTSGMMAPRPAPAPAPAAEPRSVPEEPPTPLPPAAPPAPGARREPRHAAPLADGGAKPARPRAASTAHRPHRHLVLALGAGADLYAAPSSWVPFGQLGVGLYFSAPRLLLELHGVAETAGTLQGTPHRVLRSEARAALRLERYFGTRGIIGPWLGFGVAVSRARALDLDGPVRHRSAPLAEAGVALLVARNDWVNVSAELGCHAFLVRERYVVVPDGAIGRGPLFGCQVGPTVSWASPAF
jgi:hypothetical protein